MRSGEYAGKSFKRITNVVTLLKKLQVTSAYDLNKVLLA